MVAWVALLAASGCGDGEGKLVEINGERMLVGQLIYGDILRFFPDWRVVEDTLTVEAPLVARLRAIGEPTEVLVFLATWCSDSRDGVPAFVRAIEAADNPNIRVTLYGVDDRKEDPAGLAAAYGVVRVPTFVVIRENVEVGRMVETPRESFPEDFLRVLVEGTTIKAGPGRTGSG